MKQGAILLLLGVLPALAAANNNDTILQDPLTEDPNLTIFHLFFGQWPTGLAISSTGRYFACFPAGIDSANTYTGDTGDNGVIAVGELFPDNTEVAYPNVQINHPPNGSIDYTQSPPRVKGLSDYFLGVNNIFIDSNDVLYVCDSGRAIDRNGYQALASVGGPKIVVISLENDTVIATYIFTEDVAPSDSYLSAITVDTKNNVIYIADASGTGRNAILLLDLSTGLTRRLLQNKYAVTALYGFVPYTWGQPNYQVVTDSQGNPLRATFINYGVTGLALSPGGNTLCFSRLGGRYLYCVSTEILRNPNATDSEIDSYVRNYGEKGWSAGLIFDSLYTMYGGQSEQDGVFQLLFTTQLVTLYIHDPRINFAYSFDIYNGSLCFINNQLNYLKAVYPGEGPFLVDRRVPPYYVGCYPLPDGASRAVH